MNQMTVTTVPLRAMETKHSGERDNIGEECGTDKPIQIKPKNTIHSSSIMDPVKLDKDERNRLKCLAESFENPGGHMATAWNSAMVWVDNELVFTRLNMLMVVAKDATDRVIEATSRAEMNANKNSGA